MQLPPPTALLFIPPAAQSSKLLTQCSFLSIFDLAKQCYIYKVTYDVDHDVDHM